MSQPDPYVRAYSFTDHSTSQPLIPQPGVSLDTEFDAVARTLGQFHTNLALIQRDDGGLANAIVGPDQLSLTFTIGLRSVTSWTAGVAYQPLDGIWTSAGAVYRCLIAHTASSVFANDLAAGKWELVVDFQTIANVAIQTAAIGTITVDGTTLTLRFAGIDAQIASLGTADTTEAAARAAADSTEVTDRTNADLAVAAAAAASTLAAKNLAISLALIH